MLLNFFITMGTNVAVWAINLLPDYETYPLPTWFTNGAAEIFTNMKLIFELPVLRVFVEYFWLWFPFWVALTFWNVIIKILSVLPFLGGFARLRIKEQEENYVQENFKYVNFTRRRF